MKLNQKNPMQTEGKETKKPSEITFLTKKVIILYLQPSIQRTFPRHAVTHITERHMSVSSADTITQHFLYFLAVGSF